MKNLSIQALEQTDTVVLDHGTGARLSRELVELIAEILGDTYLRTMEDSALLDLPSRQIAFTTDSFVVTPLIFGNGDIGKIAVCGTVNDLAVSGARPLYLTLSLIIEDGMPISELVTVIESVRDTAVAADVKIVAGDTKVVGKGEADRLFINTAGVGVLEHSPVSIKTFVGAKNNTEWLYWESLYSPAIPARRPDLNEISLVTALHST